MSCSVSRPVSRPDLAISARVRRTIGLTFIVIQGRDIEQCNRHVITYLSHTYNKKLFYKLINNFLKHLILTAIYPHTDTENSL